MNLDYEAAAAKAEEQHEYAGTLQLGWDSYVKNILNAAVLKPLSSCTTTACRACKKESTNGSTTD